ncbi:hypothetical protein [Actinophytocola sp.]|uniref:hypothetical protein n=1 Tax=Actinophytocola sp. TaxID=1872138 RepID=UPI00389AF17E
MLELDSRSRGAAVVVTARGVLDVTTAGRLRDYLLKVGADQPMAVVVDVAGLDIQAPAVTAVFVTAHAELARWPGVPMVLVASASDSGEVLDRQRLNRFVPVRRTVADGVAAAGEPPTRLVDRVLLPNSPASAEIARRFVRDSCVLWGHPELTGDAAALLGELVRNTVTHTDSVARIRVELRRGLLSVAVYDDDPRPPLPLDGTVEEHGLALVGRIATAWGCSPTLPGGKVVWATLRVPGQRRPPAEYSVSRGERPKAWR